MSAPLFLLGPGALDDVAAGASVVLDGAEGRHAATVRRIGAGERVDVADGAGALARCEVRSVARAVLSLHVLERLDVAEPSPRFVLVQALAKGDRAELAVESATELGVDEVLPWQAARSVVLWRGERGVKARRRWEQSVRAAAKQSRRPRVPPVSPLATSAALGQRIERAALTVVLHEEAAQPLVALTLPPAGDVLLVVGPEGGVSPDELAAFVEAGARAVRLGPQVLRSSTAGPAALAVLSAAARWR